MKSNFFSGTSLSEEKKGFTAITTDNVSFIEAGMATFHPDSIYQKFDKMKEKDSIVKIVPAGTSKLAFVNDQPFFFRLSAVATMAPTPAPKFMMFDLASKNYKEFTWDRNDVLFGAICSKMESSGSDPLFEKWNTPPGKTRADLGLKEFTPIEAAALVVEEYNMNYLTIKQTDTLAERQEKELKRKFITGVQTSLSGCLSWSKNFDFVFNADGITNSGNANSICVVGDMANFEMRFFDQRAPRKDSRVLVGKGSPKFNFVPTHPWGTAYAGNKSFTGKPGEFPPVDPGGSDNPDNNVTAELDVYYNHNTGKAEAGTRQVLAKVLTPIAGVKVNPLPANFDEQGGFPTPSESNQYMGYFGSGYAIPMTVNQGNPYMFGPVFSNKGTGCEDDKKEKLLVTNRSQRSFEVGRVVMLSRVDDEWIPMDFGDDAARQFGSIGNWNFQMLVADGDSYFKDDRFYYEEKYNPELSNSITPSQYEGVFRFNFYNTIVEAIKEVYGSNAAFDNGIDAANDPRKPSGKVLKENSVTTQAVPSGTPNSRCGNLPQPTGQTLSAGPNAYRIEANNGLWIETTISSVPVPTCWSPPVGCEALLDALKNSLPAAGSVDTTAFEAAMKAYAAAVYDEDTTSPTGDPTHWSYTGRLKLSSPPSQSNHGVKRWPEENIVVKSMPMHPTTPLIGSPAPVRTHEWGPALTDNATPYWSKLWTPYENALNDPAKSESYWKSDTNWFYSVMGATKLQTQSNLGSIAGNTTGSWAIRARCIEFGPYPSYAIAYANALVEKLEGECGAAAAAFPQVVEKKWLKAENTKTFVGSRRYLNVTSFDMQSNRWHGVNHRDWLSTSNPSFDEFGALIEDPSQQNFDLMHPFWGPLFTEGYTEESVNKLMAKRASTSTQSEICSNANTVISSNPSTTRFGFTYMRGQLRGQNGILPSDNPQDHSYGRVKHGLPISIDSIFNNGDANLVHLPADIGTNASPSGQYGSPINDFHRMVALANVVNPGQHFDPNNPIDVAALGLDVSQTDSRGEQYVGFDPKKDKEEPTATQAKLTVDWSNGKSLIPDKLAINLRKYFATKTYLVNGVDVKVQDRQCWAYEKPTGVIQDDDLAGQDISDGVITEFAFDSTYDLAPMSPKLTFMPLTAEWIGAFDQFDEIYARTEQHRAMYGQGNLIHPKPKYFENWYHTAYIRLTPPQIPYSTAVYPHGHPELKGAGWYWHDEFGKLTQDQNTTINRLARDPLGFDYDFLDRSPDAAAVSGTAVTPGNATLQEFPEGTDYTYILNGTFGGRRGDPIFKIGRNYEFVATAEMDTATVYGGGGAGGAVGAVGAPQVAGGAANYDPDFIEPENDGKPQVDLYGTANIGGPNQSVANPINHGLIGAYNNRGPDGANQQSPASSYSNQNDFNHVVKLDYGFPFDGYVRHRSNPSDDGIEGPRNCWIDDTADCVGIITARAKMSTGASNLTCTVRTTRGLTPYKPNVTGAEEQSWGAPGNNISSLGGEHLFARVFEAWPDEQILFDSRYFAVMHFNPGQLLTSPNIQEEYEYEGAKYTREVITEKCDYRVPTLLGAGTDIRGWDELQKGAKVFGNDVTSQGLMAPYELWKVSTIRRGMLLPFTYTLPTVGISIDDISIMNTLPTQANPNGAPQIGTGFTVGDTLTFQGGTGTGAKIRVTQISSNGGIDDFEVVDNGKDYLPDDFPKATASLSSNVNQAAADFEEPSVIAVPDPGSNGQNAYIFAFRGTVVYKDLTDVGPNTLQNTPTKVSIDVPPTNSDDIVGRQEDLSQDRALPLAGADGTFRNYDVFLHYHNDITSVLSYNSYESVNGGLLNNMNKVQFMRLELSAQ